MDFLYNSLKTSLFHILLKNSEKCNRELPSGSQILFIHYLLRELRPLLDSFLFIYIFKKSAVDTNFISHSY